MADGGCKGDDKFNSSFSTQTVGVIIIGDEILKGHTKDTNSYFLVRRLWSLGVKVGRVSVLPDDVETIASEVKQFAGQFSFVVTTGGIGPTHDDVTMAGIAKAFDDDLVKNQELETLIRQAYIDVEEINAAHLKMAQVPKCAKLVYGTDKISKKKSKFPIVAVRNVYVFPGVPRLLEKYFDMLESLLVPNKKQFFLHKVYLSVDETEIASILDEADLTFRESVHLGSYPNFSGAGFKVKVTLESESHDKLRNACEFLLSKLPQESVLKSEGNRDCSDVKEGLNSFSSVDVQKINSLMDPKDESKLSACVKGAWAIIQETLQLYSLDELCISFNGGKDCTVLLHIIHAAILKLSTSSTQLNAVYIQCNSPFPEVEEFVKETVSRYGLNLITLTGNIKDALEKLKTSHPSIKAIMMGTRKHDPFSGTLHNFSPTDPGWPPYMRINPILDWNHGDVWHVLKECHIPYCSLYDQGYTSLGSQHNTKPNPALKTDGDESSYKPAYLLEDGNLERAGRY